MAAKSVLFPTAVAQHTAGAHPTVDCPIPVHAKKPQGRGEGVRADGEGAHHLTYSCIMEEPDEPLAPRRLQMK
eukprot:COSAG01_NODE_4218_length_5229_cov_16.645419_3_plen_73_part_00